MRTRIARWGNGLGVRIPRNLAEDLGLDDGAAVDLHVVHGDLVIHPVEWSLEELLAGIKPENLHGETDWGQPAGREPW